MIFRIIGSTNCSTGGSGNIGGQLISQNSGGNIPQGKYTAAPEKLVGVNTKIGVGDIMYTGNGNTGKTYYFA